MNVLEIQRLDSAGEAWPADSNANIEHEESADDKLTADIAATGAEERLIASPRMCVMSEKDDSRRSPGEMSSSATDAWEPVLSVPLLKERLELEVTLRREGVRFVALIFFLVVFVYKTHLSSKPEEQSMMNRALTDQLRLDLVERAYSKKSAFEFLMNVSAHVRELAPLSSVYIDKSLDKGLVDRTTSFPHGPLVVPAEFHPKLSSDWFMHFRVGLDQPFEESPERRLIIRQHLQEGLVDMTCWALYCEGIYSFFLVYGEHNMDDGKAEVAFHFDPEMTDPTHFNLVAIQVNASHATMMLQDGAGQRVLYEGGKPVSMPGINSQPLKFGTVPTDCPGGSIEVGDRGLQLAGFEYHPGYLTDVMFHDIEEGGQTVANIAMGVKRPEAPVDLKAMSYVTRGTREVSSLVDENSENTNQLIKLAGTIAYTAREDANAAHGEGNATIDIHMVSHLEYTEYNSGVHMLPFTEVVGDTEVVMNISDVGYPDQQGAITAHMTAAFQSLRSNLQPNFTVAWWAKSQAGFKSASRSLDGGVQELLVRDTASDTTLLRMAFLEGKGLPTGGGWIVQFNSAPVCGNADEVCKRSPAFWCQGPPTSAYDGIWRHFALRVSNGSSESKSKVEVFLDGVELCGVVFDPDLELLPHLRARAPEDIIATMAHTDPDAALPYSAVSIKSAKVYAISLTQDHLDELAHDKHSQECLDLEFTVDNPDYKTEFGQSCADFAHLSNHGNGTAPGGCRLKEVLINCPIACNHELVPMCYDGMAPLPEESSSLGSVTRGMLAQPGIHELLLPEFRAPAEYWDDLLAVSGEWTDGMRGKAWQSLFRMVELVDHGMMISHNDLESPAADAKKHHWIRSAQTSDADWCPGIEADESVFGELCTAELHWEHLVVNQDATGTPPEQLNIGHGFHSGNMEHGHDSATLYFWARVAGSEGIDGISLAGMDDSNNLCFHISGTTASIMRYGSLENADALAGNILESVQVEHISSSDGVWTFFALDINTDKGKLTFAVDERVVQREVEGLKQHEFGCNNLQYVLNIGSAILLSPIRVSSHPLPPGSLQNLFIRTRSMYVHMPGSVLSNLGRLASYPLRRRVFTSPTLAITPPLLLQQRRAQGSASCEESVMDHVNHRLDLRKKHICKRPYLCSFEEDVPIAQAICKKQKGAHISPERFFGRVAHKYHGKEIFPDFAWGLEGSVLVRDGKDIFPVEDYIDANTEMVELLVPFFTGFSQTVGLLEVKLEFVAAKVENKVIMHHAKVLNDSEMKQYMTALIVAIALSVLLFLMSIPAAIDEQQSLWHYLSRYHPGNSANSSIHSNNSSAFSKLRHKIRRWRMDNPIEYSADTTQPDILDAFLFLGTSILLIYELTFKVYENKHIVEVLGDIADTDWADEKASFADKIHLYIARITDMEGMVARENLISMIQYIVMMVMIARILIFMKIHPKIAGIPSTFVRVAGDMMNFMITFGILFVFFATAAYLRFGPTIEEFSSIPSAIRTQFTLMLAFDIPAIRKDPFLTVYVVTFVVMCTLSLLNFFLAIVVNGYTKVQEESMENKVAQGFVVDLCTVVIDWWKWIRNGWPTKLSLLHALSLHYPKVFQHGFREADPWHESVTIRRSEFVRCIRAGRQQVSRSLWGRSMSSMARRLSNPIQEDQVMADLKAADDAEAIFDWMYRLRVLQPPGVNPDRRRKNSSLRSLFEAIKSLRGQLDMSSTDSLPMRAARNP